MGLCTDRSVNHLKSLGLNTILQPREGITPLALLGEFKGERGIIGTLDQLVERSAAPLPSVTSNVAANINGQRSSKLPVEIGLNLLGNVIGAMGGNLGITAAYSRARKVEFSYADVTRDRANVIQIGDYLMESPVRWSHPILRKYLFGEGRLLVLTEVVKSRSLGVTAFDEHKASLGLDIPVIQKIVGGKVSVGSEGSGTSTVTYKGDRDLAFGFVAIELSAGDSNDDGELDLVFRPAKTGSIALSMGAPSVTPTLFEGPLRSLDDLAEAEPEQGDTTASAALL